MEIQTIQWKNSTVLHEDGVCDAALCLWFEQIAKNGLDKANKIRPEDCDCLQNDIEKGEFTYLVHLLPLLKEAQIDCIFDAVAFISLSQTERNMHICKLLAGIKANNFFFIDCQMGEARGHAMGVFCCNIKDINVYYFFYPGIGIRYGTLDEIGKAMSRACNIKIWADIKFFAGYIGSKCEISKL